MVVYFISWALISLINLYLLVLIARVVLDWVRMLSRSWRPRGVVLVLANVIYTLTDPPLNYLRRVIPPLRIGAVALDIGFILLFFGLTMLQRVISYFPVWFGPLLG